MEKLASLKSCAFIQKMWTIASKCYDTFQHFCDITIRRPVSDIQKITELVVLKYLYILLSVVILKDLWYPGTGSYGVDFVFWKECVASLVYIVVSYGYVRLRIENTFLKAILLFLYVLYYMPLNSAFSITNASFGFFLQSNLYFAFVLAVVHVLNKYLLKKPNHKHLHAPKNMGIIFDNKCVNLFCAAICVLYIIHKLDYNGLDFSLSFANDDVYSSRSDYQEYLLSIGGTLFGYILVLVRQLAGAVVPFYLVSALVRRKPVAIVLVVLTLLSQFSVASQKSALLTPILMIVVYLCYRFKLLEHIDRLFIYGMALLLLACLLENFIFGGKQFYMLIIRRQMYVPTWLNTLYYDFFSQNSKVLWTDETLLLQNILPHVYDVSPLDLINNAYFKGKVPSPNTGLFAEAYMHFGFFGVILYPGLLGTMLVLFDRALCKNKAVIVVALAAKFAISMVNIPILRTDAFISIVFFMAVLWVLSRIDLAAVLQWTKQKLLPSKNKQE